MNELLLVQNTNKFRKWFGANKEALAKNCDPEVLKDPRQFAMYCCVAFRCEMKIAEYQQEGDSIFDAVKRFPIDSLFSHGER